MLTAQQLIDMGYYGYRGWPDLEANNDFLATGGAGKGGGGGGASGGDYSSGLIDTITQQVVPQALEFDVDAARRAAEQEWNPYYDELLADYLAEVTTGQTRSEADIASTLDLLGGRREDYLGDIARESPIMQEAIGGQFADRGLYESGQRQEAQQRRLEEEERQKQNYEREYQYKTGQAQLEQQRYLEDSERERKQRERDLAREREQSVTGQVETLRSEKYAGYY